MTTLETLTAFFACPLNEVQDALRELHDAGNAGRESAPEEELGARFIPIDDLAVTVPPEAIHSAVARLIERCHLNHLTTITAIDVEDAVELKYHFWQEHGFTLETTLPADELTIATITDIIPGAAFYEREIYGMFGVDFTGHPELRPLLLPDDWQGGPPLRKEPHDD